MNLVYTSVAFYCAVLEVEKGVFEVHSTLAGTHLGGDDFDMVQTREIGTSLAYILCFLIYSYLSLTYTLTF